jgi:benzylsuccinate CoA-transferase BbsF subunit
LNDRSKEATVNMEKQALAGVKVLDFGWAIVGSLIGKHLADHGAQVVRVESVTRLGLERSNVHVSISKATNPDDKSWYTQMNTSKYGITLDLKHPRAREVINKLLRWADVVSENFTLGTMDKLGLGYDDIRKVKPDIVMVGASVFGQTGPLTREWGIDATGNALSGRNDLCGWTDREPLNPSSAAYGDDLLPLLAAMAIIAALDHKRRTGKGQYIDASMLDVLVHQISPVLLDWEMNARLQTRTGNRISYASPHGVFPCIGDDRWCAIAVFTDEEWKAFCQVLGNPQWTGETRFTTLNSRKENEDELEELVAEWTIKPTAEEVMIMMQASGVSARVVQNAQDVIEKDPQLKEREFLVPLNHPVLGVFGHITPPYKLLKAKASVRTSPCLSEHTYYVCTKLLGMSDEEFTELEQRGVFQ